MAILIDRSLLLFVTLGVALAGCTSGEVYGATRSTRNNAVASPPLMRGSPDAHLVAACGDGLPTEAGVASMRRSPYLQQVDASSAMVLFTSTTSDSLTVRVTTPEGAEVATLASSIEPTMQLGGAKQHVAKVEGLEPASIYCYALEQDGAPLVRPAGFRTAPAPGSDASVSFIAFGDSGSGGDDQMTLRAQMEAVPFDLALVLGDIAYEDGTLDQLERNYFDAYSPLLGSLPFFPTSGNHEYRTADAAPFREVFALPENGAPAGIERWYSFDYGAVHFVALDTEKNGEEQAAWLERDLAATAQPWIVVMGHRPPYSSGGHGSDPLFRELYAPIVERHRVALVLSGHDHHYERMTPQNGVTYVVSGGGGKSTRATNAPLAETAFSEPVVHFVHVTVEGDAMTVRAIDATGQEFDSVVIERAR